MAGQDGTPASGRIQRFRFRVVAPDGRELLSDVAHVRLPAAPFRVTQIYVGVKGKKQGAFKGESVRSGTEEQFAALSLDYDLRVPLDATTGGPSGKRQHSPLSIVKEWGAASPQLFQALVTNEELETVEIDCYGPGIDGGTELVHKVRLSNAGVASIEQSSGQVGGARELERVAFSFETLEHLTPGEGLLAKDSLSAKA